MSSDGIPTTEPRSGETKSDVTAATAEAVKIAGNFECNFSEFENIRKAKAVHAGPRIKANISPIRISVMEDEEGGQGIEAIGNEVEQGGAMEGPGLVYVYNDSTQDPLFLDRSFLSAPPMNRSLSTAAIALIKVANKRGCSIFLTFSGIIFPAIIAVIVVPPNLRTKSSLYSSISTKNEEKNNFRQICEVL